ncbi:hypothetical protein [uncultured Methanoregula sp.]|uniref:hypothetical protein n=1 Tax=uncultured Methanoregula sp. TaxID=1005933 RepID=UPI002AAB5BD1|nr:hypothetical protein [uncultured Methanoregula sp.]
MEKGDILTVVGGLAIVIVIALVINPQYLAGILSPGHPVSPAGAVNPVPTPRGTLIPIVLVTPEPVAPPLPYLPDSPPYRIYYASDPFKYPRFKMPENMETFGASEPVLHYEKMVPFAYVQDTRGGVTQKFSVPYPVWILNITVNAARNPQYGNLRMVVCYASNGTVIDGAEILNRGGMIRVMQTSNTDLYMIITTQYIDWYQIELETPRNYYDRYRPR